MDEHNIYRALNGAYNDSNAIADAKKRAPLLAKARQLFLRSLDNAPINAKDPDSPIITPELIDILVRGYDAQIENLCKNASLINIPAEIRQSLNDQAMEQLARDLYKADSLKAYGDKAAKKQAVTCMVGQIVSKTFAVTALLGLMDQHVSTDLVDKIEQSLCR
jgi:hypothetical protein